MVKEHVCEGIPLHEIAKKYEYDVATIKHYCNLYRKHGEKCIEEFNHIYKLDSKLKEKQKGKNKYYTPYERLKFNEKANELKQELNNLRNEVSDLEDNKKYISKEITNLNKDKDNITDEIDKKKTMTYHYSHRFNILLLL